MAKQKPIIPFVGFMHKVLAKSSGHVHEKNNLFYDQIFIISFEVVPYYSQRVAAKVFYIRLARVL